MLLTYAIILASSRCIQDCTFLKHSRHHRLLRRILCSTICLYTIIWPKLIQHRKMTKYIETSHHFIKCTNGISHHKHRHKSRI